MSSPRSISMQNYVLIRIALTDSQVTRCAKVMRDVIQFSKAVPKVRTTQNNSQLLSKRRQLLTRIWPIVQFLETK